MSAGIAAQVGREQLVSGLRTCSAHTYAATGEESPEVAQEASLRGLNEAVTTEADRGSIAWTSHTTLQARAALSRMKSTGRGSASAEVLQALSAEAMWAIHLMLQANFTSSQESPMTWRHIRLFLLPKTRRPGSWSEFRGISLLNVMSKLFMAGVMCLIRERSAEHLSSTCGSPLQFGFEADCKCEDLLACLQQALQAAEEWPAKHSVVIANTDVKQAFDYQPPSVVVDSMHFWKCPAVLGARTRHRKLGCGSRGSLHRTPVLRALRTQQMCTPRRVGVAMVLQPCYPDH